MYDVAVRLGAVAILTLCASAHADPRAEVGVVFGVDRFGDDIKLGNSTFPEQRPQTAPLVGVRGTLLFLHVDRFELGLEPEVAFTASWTGYGFDGPRASEFAPVLGYRGSLVAQVQLGDGFALHGAFGVGGESVFSSSVYIANTTDFLYFYGLGLTVPLYGSALLRLDFRQGFMPARAGGTTEIYEGTVGVAMRFGDPAPVIAPPPVVVKPVAPLLPPPEPDRDGDGVPDRLDRCPDLAGQKPDGCPPDPDGDGIYGAADKCPDQAEDFDHFEDEDGCPDPDNDQDGIPDAADKCPNQPETKNGFQDEDGCPDEIPAEVAASFEAAGAVRFDASRAKLSDAAKASLVRVLGQLRAHPTMHVVVTGHPDKAGDKPEALAKKRAEVVKWYLVEQGVPADQLETMVGDVNKAPVEMHAAPPSAHQ